MDRTFWRKWSRWVLDHWHFLKWSRRVLDHQHCVCVCVCSCCGYSAEVHCGQGDREDQAEAGREAGRAAGHTRTVWVRVRHLGPQLGVQGHDPVGTAWFFWLKEKVVHAYCQFSRVYFQCWMQLFGIVWSKCILRFHVYFFGLFCGVIYIINLTLLINMLH